MKSSDTNGPDAEQESCYHCMMGHKAQGKKLTQVGRNEISL